MQAIYTAENTRVAFQLNWSVSLFGKVALPPQSDWFSELKSAAERDGLRILDFHAPQPNVGQFLVSTTPYVSPSAIVRSLKGRWQHAIKSKCPKAFRRNYYITSVGEANCRALEQYVGRQTSKHRMADDRLQTLLEALQFHDVSVELGETNVGHYGQYVHSLQIVVENEGGWNEFRPNILGESRAMIVRAARQKGWRLARIGLLANHLHILLGAGVTESPGGIALSLMNNLAYVQGMKAVLKFSFYVGSLGRYDRAAVRRNL